MGRGLKSPRKLFPSHNSKTMAGVGEEGGKGGVLDRGGTLCEPPGTVLSRRGLTLFNPLILTSWIDSKDQPCPVFLSVGGAQPQRDPTSASASLQPSPLLPITEQTSGAGDKSKATLCLPCTSQHEPRALSLRNGGSGGQGEGRLDPLV